MIVGAGPAGLILGLLLAKQNIQVDLVDASPTLDRQPRAAHYASPAAYELDRAGVLDDVHALGIKPNTTTWRKPDTTPIASLRLDKVPPGRERHSMVVLPLNQLGEILYAHLQLQRSARVYWSHRVVAVHQDPGEAWVECETPKGLRRFHGDYVIGCDGVGSTVRQELFGMEYPGETLKTQLIATNVSFLPCLYPMFCRFKDCKKLTTPRYTTILPDSPTTILTISSIHSTSTWPRVSRRTACTV